MSNLNVEAITPIPGPLTKAGFYTTYKTVFDQIYRASQEEFFENKASQINIEPLDSPTIRELKVVLLINCSNASHLEIAPVDRPIVPLDEPKVSFQKFILSMLYSDLEYEAKMNHIDYVTEFVSKSNYHDLGISVINRCLMISGRYKKYRTALESLKKSSCKVRISSQSFERIGVHLLKSSHNESLSFSKFNYLTTNYNSLWYKCFTHLLPTVPMPLESGDTTMPEDLQVQISALDTDDEMELLGLGLAYNRLTQKQNAVLADYLTNSRSNYELVQAYKRQFIEEFLNAGVPFEEAQEDLLEPGEEIDTESLTSHEAEVLRKLKNKRKNLN